MITGNVAGNGVKPLIFKALLGFATRGKMSGGLIAVKYLKALIYKAFGGFPAVNGNTSGGISAAAMACMTFMLLIFMASGAFAQARPALFLGLMNDRGEPVQSEMEQAARNALAANPSIKLIDKLETQRFVREKERLGRGNVENFIPPNMKLDSSTVIIKGIVQDPVFELKRHWLLWGRIDARISVKFHFEEISGAARYEGDFSASAMKRKDFLLFASARKNVHISAADREGLLGEMQAKIVREVSDFASTFFNALTADTVDVDTVDTTDAVNNTDTADTADTINQVNEPDSDSSITK